MGEKKPHDLVEFYGKALRTSYRREVFLVGGKIDCLRFLTFRTAKPGFTHFHLSIYLYFSCRCYFPFLFSFLSFSLPMSSVLMSFVGVHGLPNDDLKFYKHNFTRSIINFHRLSE